MSIVGSNSFCTDYVCSNAMARKLLLKLMLKWMMTTTGGRSFGKCW
jgi:hypothetical protein